MAVIAKKFDSLRPNRFESERIVLALMISLTAHLIAFGGYEFSREVHLPPWLHLFQKKAEAVPQIQNYEQPLEFVTVEQPSAEAPQNAKYYSDKNSRAANPNAQRETEIPQLNGKQTEVAKTEDAPRQNFNKLQPQEPDSQQHESRPAVQPGDLTLAKPEDLKQQEQPRARTIKQALAQNHLPGIQMRQEGGVQRISIDPGFDVKATQFGRYDERIIAAIQQRWDDLLESHGYALDRPGKVTVRFHLNYDGRITDMEVLENTVGELLGVYCQDAIIDPAPFEQWPSDMRRMVGANFRELTFTFYYDNY